MFKKLADLNFEEFSDFIPCRQFYYYVNCKIKSCEREQISIFRF